MHCRTVPEFAKARGYSESSVLDTQARQKGLIVYDPPAKPGEPPTHVYRHPTWERAGYLGPLTTDRAGNIYVAPAPRVSLYDNPPEQQNTIYKVDTTSGEMAEFMRLPAAAPTSSQNPYGVLGLTYDCDTHSLYASSVAGSTLADEVGRIYQIDLASGKIRSQLVRTDAFGLAVFNGTSGKRLYFGAARASEIRSVALADDGRFVGRPRVDVSIVGWGPEGDDKARRIVFDVRNVMTIRGMEFEFNLIATSERRQSEYHLAYDPTSDGWRRLEPSAE
ncbi:MAG TPA: hypothetical protein VMW17_15595 [Candidatus Binatia bacterium]|nr:hypothetical protein [Candidatus Binatia bacterium]